MTLETKIEKVVSLADCQWCFASKSRGTIIDVIHPNTGKTVIYGKTLEECRAEKGYEDAEEITVDEFCAWKSATQRTPIVWTPTTEEKYEEMLNVLPPALWIGGGFLVGEPWDHDAGNGQPRFAAYRCQGEVYEMANRPLTRAEFRAEVQR